MSVTAAPPDRSLAQRMDALEKANVIRTRRARLKRDLKASRARIDVLLVGPPDWLETCKVFDLIVSLPKRGEVKASQILAACRISPSKTVGGLSDRQRTDLVAMLRTGVRRG